MTPVSSTEPNRLDTLTLLASLKAMRTELDTIMDRLVMLAAQEGKSGAKIGAALGVSASAIRKRWPNAVRHRRSRSEVMPHDHR
jgi:hypothetical protein